MAFYFEGSLKDSTGSVKRLIGAGTSAGAPEARAENEAVAVAFGLPARSTEAMRDPAGSSSSR